MIESARATSNFVFDKLERMQKQNAKNLTKDELEKARAEIRSGLRSSEDALISADIPDDEDYTLPRPLKVGDEVRVIGIDKVGTVLKIADKNGNVSVRIGIVTSKIEENKLRLIEKSGKKTPKKKFFDMIIYCVEVIIMWIMCNFSIDIKKTPILKIKII